MQGLEPTDIWQENQADDGACALWASVLRQAVRDAEDDTPDGADARAFLADPAQLAPICAVLDIDVTWFQAQYRRRQPRGTPALVTLPVPAPQTPTFGGRTTDQRHHTEERPMPQTLAPASFREAVQQEMAQLDQHMAEIEQDIARLQAQIVTLQEQRNQITRQRSPLHHYLTITPELHESPRPHTQREPHAPKVVPLRPGRPVSPDSQAVHIANVLRRATVPLHYNEILVRLAEEEQTRIAGRSPGNNLRARMAAYSQFVNMGKGFYVLREEVTHASQYGG